MKKRDRERKEIITAENAILSEKEREKKVSDK
jgi:hypothetical protein